MIQSVAILTTFPLLIETTMFRFRPRGKTQLLTPVVFLLLPDPVDSLALYFMEGWPQAFTRRLMESPVFTSLVPHLKLPASALAACRKRKNIIGMNHRLCM